MDNPEGPKKIKLTKRLVCNKCNAEVIAGDPMAGTAFARCPSCYAADLGVDPRPEIATRIDELNGKYALYMEIKTKGFPDIKMSLGESQIRQWLKAIDHHRETGNPVIDRANGDGE